MGVFIFLRVAFLVVAQIKISRKLHDNLITRVFQAPVNIFFDVTPIGKILNRFSKDLSVVDEQIFFDFDVFLEYLYLYLAALIVTGYSVPYTIIIIALFLLAGICLFRYTIKAYKDTYRLSQVAMSPLLSFFQETFTGTSVIRAFKKDEEFKMKSFELRLYSLICK